MASAITHFIVGASVAWPFTESRAIRIAAGAIAAAPDLDVYAMAPYNSFFGHRGFFHSPCFLILFCMLLARGNIRLGTLWWAAAITHPLLDMLTDGGLGVMLLVPFSQVRLFFPWTPIHVSPIGIARFFSVAGYILSSEWPFCLAAVALAALATRFRSAIVSIQMSH